MRHGSYGGGIRKPRRWRRRSERPRDDERRRESGERYLDARSNGGVHTVTLASEHESAALLLCAFVELATIAPQRSARRRRQRCHALLREPNANPGVSFGLEMPRTACFLLVAACAVSGCAARARPQVAPATAPDRLPDDGPTSCVNVVMSMKPQGFEPRRGCVTDTVELDYASLPVLSRTRDAPDEARVVEAVNRYRSALDIGINYPVSAAEWVDFSPNNLKPDSLDVFYGEKWDGPVKQETGRAKAIIRDEFYAFRHCREGCEESLGDPARVETLVLIGPAAQWIESSMDDFDQTGPDFPADDETPFSFVSARVGPGSSATVGMTISADDLAQFKNLADAKSAKLARAAEEVTQLTTLTLEVVWPKGSLPELVLERGRSAGIPRRPQRHARR